MVFKMTEMVILRSLKVIHDVSFKLIDISIQLNITKVSWKNCRNHELTAGAFEELSHIDSAFKVVKEVFFFETFVFHYRCNNSFILKRLELYVIPEWLPAAVQAVNKFIEHCTIISCI